MTDALNHDQFLPGMEGMRPAEPHEQTEAQFNNRPDVMVHGRYTWRDKPMDERPYQSNIDFHVGTRQAALERVETLGAPHHSDMHARFYVGQVDPRSMENTPETPITDMGVDWTPSEVGHYYRNDSEDRGSISAVLDAENVRAGTSFRSWRGAVSDALRTGQRVPEHVKSLYQRTGGSRGSQATFDTAYRGEQPLPKRTTRYRSTEDAMMWQPGGYAASPSQAWVLNGTARPPGS